MTTTNTPGYNTRIGVWFDTDAAGRKAAYYWSPGAMRAIRMGRDLAEMLLAADQADRLSGHPMRRAR
jgi:hypothetical protein